MATEKKGGIGAWYAGFKKKLSDYGLEPFYCVLVVIFFLLLWIPTHGAEFLLVGGFLLAFLPFYTPVLLGIMVWASWFEYKRQQDYWSNEYSVLEIRLPEEITQSPHAMELMLRVLYQSGEVDTPLHNLRGKTKPWFSLEIASTEGAVRFYIWTRSRYKDIVKAQLYAHYPTVQVVEVPDYTLALPWDPSKVDIWGVEQALQKPDPYPIATYMLWNVEKADTKEEFKNDPIVSLLEFMGSIGPGEHLWFQIILKGHTKNMPPSYAPYALVDGPHEEFNIEEWANYEREKILEKTIPKDVDDNKKEVANYTRLSQGDKDLLDAMDRKLAKQAFDVGIRFVYIAKIENKIAGRNAGLPTAMRSFEHGSEGRGLNGLKPVFYIGPFNWPWQDFRGIRRALLKRRLYEGYVSRQYFYEPIQDMHIVLNVEEIASLYHFPGKVAHTPTLQRMPSRRSEAPSNLPV